MSFFTSLHFLWIQWFVLSPWGRSYFCTSECFCILWSHFHVVSVWRVGTYNSIILHNVTETTGLLCVSCDVCIPWHKKSFFFFASAITAKAWLVGTAGSAPLRLFSSLMGDCWQLIIQSAPCYGTPCNRIGPHGNPLCDQGSLGIANILLGSRVFWCTLCIP